LPAGVTGLRALLLAAGGDLDDWHQLDHYTAVRCFSTHSNGQWH
jgi:hypothetical protein